MRHVSQEKLSVTCLGQGHWVKNLKGAELVGSTPQVKLALTVGNCDVALAVKTGREVDFAWDSVVFASSYLIELGALMDTNSKVKIRAVTCNTCVFFS